MQKKLAVIGSTFIALSVVIIVAAMVLWFETSQRAVSTPDDLPPAEEIVAPMFMTTMTHMEGSFRDDVDRDLYMRHVDQLRWAMDLFDEYGAKLTVESEQPFAIANTTWGLNVMQEIVDRGHGVGTHADFGAELVPKDVPFYTRAFRENKALVDALVGAENNRGISGGPGAYDWVVAMSRAGFDYVDGVTGFGYLAMPLSARPDGWTDEYIRTETYHDPAPVDFARRITMYDLKNADDFIPDADGILAISGGELGELASLSEGRSSCAPDCELTTADIDVIFAAIEAAQPIRNATDVLKLNAHIPLALLTLENETVLRYFLSGMQERTEEGSIAWATQGEAYSSYTETK